MRKVHVPLRTCLGCLKRRPKGDLLRFVASPDGLKISGQGGRGLYVCANTSCLHKALKRKDIRNLAGTGVAGRDPGDLIRGMLGQNNLDGTYLERVICSERRGGGGVG